MSTLYIDRKNANVDVEGDTIVVRVEGERQGTAPLRLLERLVLRSTSSISSRAISKLAERGAAVLVLSGRKNAPAAVLTAPSAGDAALRVAQYDLINDEHSRRWLSAGIVRTKLASQMHVLQKQNSSKHLEDAMRRINAITERLESRAALPTRSKLRGIEGAAAAVYFKGFATLFAESLGFTSRNRRPPRDPVNVCLSLGYTLLHAEAVRIAANAGLDPMLGIYHDLSPGRESLACDLAEPVRALVDRWALSLFRERRLKLDHFSSNAQTQACRLGKAGREIVYRSFEEEAQTMRGAITRTTRALIDELRGRKPPTLSELTHE